MATGPAALALLMTLGNALKPPAVDDTAYLLFARQIATHPLDPYRFELFWYYRPEPAMGVLLPPVLPYWLAAGIALLGERPPLLKLWLFPVFWLFCRAAWTLLGRFAPGRERPGTALLALGPAALPLTNFMLDVPAAAFALAAVAAFVAACDRGSVWRAAVAGLLAGLAMQTKYTALTVPAVLGVYGLLAGRLWFALVAAVTAGGVFAAWELWLVSRYGQSHFLFHLGDQSGGDFRKTLMDKADLYRPLVAQLGGLAVAWGLLAGWAVGVGRRWLLLTAGFAVAGSVAVAVVPQSQAVLLRNGRTGSPRLDLPSLVYLPLGYLVLVNAARVAWAEGRRSRDGLFLTLWLLVELAGYFALTPFPASRRVVPTVLVLGLLVSRSVARTSPPPRWLLAGGIASGVGLLALDTWDARVEPAVVADADAVIGDPNGATVWTQGHWGWQYAADRRGWRQVEPGVSHLVAGDWLVLPVVPEATGFYRPDSVHLDLRPDATALVQVADLVWQDRLAGQTVPNLYGGPYPVVGRDHPRLRVRVYRVARDWTPATARTPGTG